jgi:DNA polymerase-3 subunit delta
MVSNQGRYEKKSVTSAVEAHGAVTRFFPLLDREVVTWIEGWTKARGLSLPRDAAQYLWQTIGNDLQAINNELEKIEIYIKEKKAITLGDVKAVVGDFRVSSFDFAGSRIKGRQNVLILSRCSRRTL